VSHAARDWDQEGLALGDGILCVAGLADAQAGRGIRGPHADALPEWPGGPGTWDDEGWEWLYADQGHRDCVGLGPLSTGEHVDPVVSGPVWPGQCAPPEHGACGAGAAVTDRPVALPTDGSTPSGCRTQGGGSKLDHPSAHEGPQERDNRFWAGVDNSLGGTGSQSEPIMRRGCPPPGFTGAQSACRIGCLTQKRSTRIEGRLGPGSSTDHEATSPGQGTRCHWTCHRDSQCMRRGR
jgi:hypothetical protein